MSDLAFHHLGENPEAEAVRLRALYTNPGVDDAVEAEFLMTVLAYQNHPLDVLTQRVEAKYCGDNPTTHSAIVVANGEDVGMGTWGIKNFELDQQVTRGVNLSSWLLSPYRSQGIGTRFARYRIEHATKTMATSPNWKDRTVWTSIHADNIASQKAIERAGLVEVGLHARQPDRLIYVLK